MDDRSIKSQDSLDSSSSSSSSSSTKRTLVYKESCHKFACLRVPIRSMTPSMPSVTSGHHHHHHHQTHGGDQTQPIVRRHSYALSFMLRFDDNLVRFSRAYRLDDRVFSGPGGSGSGSTGGTNFSNRSSDSTSQSGSLQSYTHVISVNLDNEQSTFELWLNQNGQVLFLRRSEQAIVAAFNLFQIFSGQWYYVHINYDEEQMRTKYDFKIGYSLNAKEIVEKEIEIFSHPDQNKKTNQNQTSASSSSSSLSNLYMYVGHQEKRDEPHLFNYDLGQIILLKGNCFKFFLLSYILLN